MSRRSSCSLVFFLFSVCVIPLISCGGFCPSCALRALGLTDQAFTNNGNDDGTSDMFGGDPQVFGTNLGKQIAMRIMQAYDGNSGQMGGQPIVVNSMSSFPETRQETLNLGSASSTGNTSEPAKLNKLEKEKEEKENEEIEENEKKEREVNAGEKTPQNTGTSSSSGSFDPNEFARRFREQYLGGGNTQGAYGSYGSLGYNANTMPPVFGSFGNGNGNNGNMQVVQMPAQPNKGKCPYCFGNNGNYKKMKKLKRNA